ncbi:MULTISPECIES: hypothetical protein [Arenibacter]|uniref:hypothetical protein n=1 Tax=Arenibacter TaxID=178469 RepID=UPI0012FFE26A|nr:MULTISPECIES: hypothetical protein [Arenibacter]
MLFFSCNQALNKSPAKPITNSISIFEIYLEDSVKVNHFSSFLRDTLKLPVEWEPFDIFGNDVVYDAAFHLGNTTLELLSVSPPMVGINKEAKYNRILFHSENIDSTSIAISNAGINHGSPFDFKIISKDSQVTIGKQINLDSMSKRSNVNIAFWQYLDPGYNFAHRTIKGQTKQKLDAKLKAAMKSNPLGIVGLKEVHLLINQSAINDWRKLFGDDAANKWVLENGPIISYTLSDENIGVDWITLVVQNLDKAKEFLSQKNILSTQNQRLAINQSAINGLKIYIEE